MTQQEIDRTAKVMPTLEGVEVPNLDDYSVDPDDYVALERLYELLSLYCEQKRHAMRYRFEGDIECAISYEKAMQRTYERLPAWARW